MDELLKPRILKTEPNKQIYKHWLKTFQCFLTSAEATRRNADNEPQLNKLSLLFKYVSHRIYLYIEDSTTYEDAKQMLDRIYLKQKNEIFTRHLLSITNVRIKPETHMNLLRIRLSRFSIASLNVLQDKVTIKVVTI